MKNKFWSFLIIEHFLPEATKLSNFDPDLNEFASNLEIRKNPRNPFEFLCTAFSNNVKVQTLHLLLIWKMPDFHVNFMYIVSHKTCSFWNFIPLEKKWTSISGCIITIECYLNDWWWYRRLVCKVTKSKWAKSESSIV